MTFSDVGECAPVISFGVCSDFGAWFLRCLSAAMAAFAACGSLGVRAPFCSVKSGAPLRVHKQRWRVASSLSEWRRECGELRVQVHELRGALADAWMHDDVLLLELESLVSSLAARSRDGEVSVTSSVFVKSEEEDAKPELEGDDENEVYKDAMILSELKGDDENEIYKDAVILSELRSEELRSKQEGLSTMRRLKTLNVHDYVHNALRESHLRSWLRSRGIAE